jgi:hypothetical protein
MILAIIVYVLPVRLLRGKAVVWVVFVIVTVGDILVKGFLVDPAVSMICASKPAG